MKKLLDLKELHTHFYTPEGVVKAVNGVSFSISSGKTLGILGESGCGKSVTALSIMRLIPDPPGKIRAGKIDFSGTDLTRMPLSQIRRIRGNQISMIFQEPMTSLNPVYTVGNQISETYITHQGLNQKEAMDKAVEMLQMVGIPSPDKRVHEFPHQLSGGMRQRVMIAIAMACKPQLLIADEPTTALDVTIQAQILDLMLRLQDELGMSIMIITHDLGVIAEVSDEVVVMYAGQVVENSTIDTLFDNSRHPYTIGLMQSIPQLGRKFKIGKESLKEIPGTVPNLIKLPDGCMFWPRCSKVMERCRHERPPTFTLTSDHGVRCWLAE
jgi:peptide/nickel transport system ATP-binding protein/oligopeptide transport system ATP-binding protein